ncbi:MAG: hypothetical protein JWM11_2915 [Planctomycetaceae bacterium]|nr:hypothetical protein [Planctomycetaceae bacterium]
MTLHRRSDSRGTNPFCCKAVPNQTLPGNLGVFPRGRLALVNALFCREILDSNTCSAASGGAEKERFRVPLALPVFLVLWTLDGCCDRS